MSLKNLAYSLVSLLLILGTVNYLYSSFSSDLKDFNDNLTLPQHLLCLAQQFKVNDYDNCINNENDKDCKENYYLFQANYQQNQSRFSYYYQSAPEDIQQIVQGWDQSCNTFEHYKRCGNAEWLFTHCIFYDDAHQCRQENQEYYQAALKCQEVGNVPQWTANILIAECLAGIVSLAKGQLASSLACS